MPYALISDSKSPQELLQRLRRILPRNIPSLRVLLSSSIGLEKDLRGESQLPFRRSEELRQPRAIQSRQRSRRVVESSISCWEYILSRMSEPPQNDYEQKEELRFSTDGLDRSRLRDSGRCVIPLAARFGTLGGNWGALPLHLAFKMFDASPKVCVWSRLVRRVIESASAFKDAITARLSNSVSPGYLPTTARATLG